MKLSHDRSRMRRIAAPEQFGKVAVLLGGASTERDISLISGKAVLAALQRRGIDATAVDPRDDALAALPAKGYARAFIALHGPGGEDGSVQGALEMIGLPYTGSGVMGSALGMDKLRTKRLAAAVGVATADSVVLRTVGDCAIALERLGLPMIVKPATQGSSVGMTKVTKAEELEPAYRAAAALDDSVFAEKWITGAEYTVAVLHRRVLPAIRIEVPNGFYDYEAKYKRNDNKYHIPAGLSAQAEAHMASLALATFDAVGAEGWGRVDFMADQTGRPLLLEINTVPGMTDHSLVPKAAAAAGIDFEELCWQVLETSFVREAVKESAR
ncbi:MAG TPA: D-alanine--D-alanine ligase [Steroidobacteraceae bacterium]|nr:D-alanine--D-alanine ligase [Steroidobacteraceae bacterium]